VRDLQVFGILNVRIAMGPSKGRFVPALHRRMVDRVVRDVDILTHAPAPKIEPAVTSQTGRTIVSATVIPAGDGPALELLTGAAPPDSVIIVPGGTPFAVSNTIEAKDGMTIMGGGGSLLVQGLNTGAQFAFVAPGTRPTINSTGAGATFSALNDSALIAMDLAGGENGVFANANDVVVQDLTIANTANRAFVADTAQNLIVSDLTITNPGVDGVRLKDVTNVMMTNVTVNGALEEGVNLDRVNGGVFTNITVSQTQDGGFVVDDSSQLTVVGLNVGPTNDEGIRIRQSSQLTFNGFAIANTVDDGVLVADSNNVTLLNGTVDSTDGVRITDSSNLTLSNLAVTNSAAEGLHIEDSSQSTFTNWTISVAGEHGVFVANSNNLTLTGMNVFAPTDDGIRLETVDAIVLQNSSFDMNNAGDSVVDLRNATNLGGDQNTAVNFATFCETIGTNSGQFTFISPGTGTCP